MVKKPIAKVRIECFIILIVSEKILMKESWLDFSLQSSPLEWSEPRQMPLLRLAQPPPQYSLELIRLR